MHVLWGEARHYGEAATEYIFRTCDNLMSVLGSTNWKSSRLEVVVNTMSHNAQLGLAARLDQTCNCCYYVLVQTLEVMT